MSLAGRSVIVAAGPTTEVTDLDRVRVATMTNRSTGTFGALVAALLLARGAQVHYLHGRGALLPGARLVLDLLGLRPADLRGELEPAAFEGIEDLIAALAGRLASGRVFATLMIVAGSDYRFGQVLKAGRPLREGKVESEGGDLMVTLVPVRKAIAEVKRLAPGTLLVGTKLEAGVSVEELVARAHGRLVAYGADLFIANTDEALRSLEAEHHFVFPDGSSERHAGKVAAARAVVEWLDGKARG